MTSPLRMARRFHPFPPQFRQPFRDTYVPETWGPPTFVAEYEPSWTTTTSPKTVSVTTDVGDVLVVNANCHTTETITAPTGGTGLTWTLQQSTVNVTNRRTMYAWTATASTAETFTMSVARTGTLEWGYNCLRFSGSSGIGASAETDGGPSSAAPTFVAEYESVWNTTTTPKTVSVTTAVGDVLVFFGMSADAAAVVGAPTGGTGLTWTLQQSHVTGGSQCGVWVRTATATTAETFTMSVARTGTTTFHWGFSCLRFSGSSGIGASNKATTTGSSAPTVTFSTTGTNSAVVVANDDFNAGSGARTWNTTAGAFTETTYSGSTGAGQHTAYGGYHGNVGAAGSKTFGLTAPSQRYSIIAVEVLGDSGAATAPSVPITAMRDRSALVVNVADFAAADGASRAWLTNAGTFTETTYDRVVSKYTVYGGYHADPGSGGMYTVGLSAPTQTFTITAIEVLGAPGTAPPPSTITPPTFVAEYEVAVWNTTTTPKTVSVTTAVGDVLVVYGVTNETPTTLNTPTGGTNLTWTLRQSVTTPTSIPGMYLWTTTATTAETFTLSVTRGAAVGTFGFNCLRWSGVSSVGASNKATDSPGAPSVNVITTQDNSAVIVANADWLVLDGTSRVWRTGAGALTEVQYLVNSPSFTAYGGYHADAGTAGSKTVGLSAPTGQAYAITAIELLGVAVAFSCPPPVRRLNYGALLQL